MKKFEEPAVEIKNFDLMDIITASSGEDCPLHVDCDSELPGV